MPGSGFDGRFGDMRAIHARFAVDVRRVLCRAYERPVHAPGYGNIVDISQRADFEGVARGLFERLIAGHGGNSEQVYFRMMGSQQDGDCIVVTGVAVKDDFVFHALCFRGIKPVHNSSRT